MKLNIPNDVKHILTKLNNAGYDAYVVGGCVRDSLMGNVPNDWDICTSALPNQTTRVFEGVRVIPTGMKHGTVTVVIHDTPYEITTFRIDGDYSDGRRPNSVQFTDNLEKDLSRRDFTVNAMAYHPDIGLIDPYGGQSDIQSRTIRCVGVPQHRFQEDALRILRALRFAIRFSFTLHSDTAVAVRELAYTLSKISAERITSELNEMITYINFYEYMISYHGVFTSIIPELQHCVYFNQQNPYHCFDVYKHIANAISYGEPDLVTKLALLFHDIGKPYCQTFDEVGVGHFYGHAKVSADMADTIMRRMRYDNSTRRQVVELVLYHDTVIEPQIKSVKRWLNRIGSSQLKRLIDIRISDVMAQGKDTNIRVEKALEVANIVESVLSSQQCFTLKDLAINGTDLLSRGYEQGEQIGKILGILLDKVISEELDNSKEALISALEDIHIK